MKSSVSVFVLLFFHTLSPSCLLAQQPGECDTVYALERWSAPVRLPDRINGKVGSGGVKMWPSWNPDGRTLYYYSTYPSQSIMQTSLTDTGWTEPIPMPAVRGISLIRGTCMAPDGKTFYFSKSGTMWATRLDEKTGKWDRPTPLRIISDTSQWIDFNKPIYTLLPLNTESICMTAGGRQIYFTGSGKTSCHGRMMSCAEEVMLSIWDDSNQCWGERCNLPWDVNYSIVCPHLGPYSRDNKNPSITADGRKLYFSKQFSDLYNDELCVSYLDGTGVWTRARRLNINSYADSSDSRIWMGITGYDEQPAITPDGKTLVFASRRNSLTNGWPEELYISHLIVDENGDSVSHCMSHIPGIQLEFPFFDAKPLPFLCKVTTLISDSIIEFIGIFIHNIPVVSTQGTSSEVPCFGKRL